MLDWDFQQGQRLETVQMNSLAVVWYQAESVAGPLFEEAMDWAATKRMN
jgi:hypothetical protein